MCRSSWRRRQGPIRTNVVFVAWRLPFFVSVPTPFSLNIKKKRGGAVAMTEVRPPDESVEEVLLGNKEKEEERIADELVLINPGNKRRRLRPSNNEVVNWAQLVYKTWEPKPPDVRSTFIREVRDFLVPKWEVSFHPERGGIALASRTVTTKIAQLRVFWKFWISENCLFYTTLENYREDEMHGPRLFSRYSDMKSSEFRMKEGFSQLRIDELSTKDLLLLSINPESPDVATLHVRTAKALIPFPRTLLEFLKMKQIVVCLGHFVKKAVVVYRMSPAYIALILNTLRANVLVFYRWKLGSNTQLQRVLVALENLTRQLGSYGRIERRRFGAANTSLSWLDFQLMRHVFTRKVAVFLFTKFKPSDFKEEKDMIEVFIDYNPRSFNKTHEEKNKAFRYTQLAIGISQLMLLGCLSGPTLRPSMLPKISRSNLKFKPLDRPGPDTRWVYYYDDSFNPLNFNKVSSVQTSFMFPFPHFFFPIEDAEGWVEEESKETWADWRERSNELLGGSWYEDNDLTCFSLFNLVLTLFFHTPLGALAHLSALGKTKELSSKNKREFFFTEDNLKKVGWSSEADTNEVLMLLPNLNTEFDMDLNIRKATSTETELKMRPITESLQENVLKLLYRTNSCVYVGRNLNRGAGGFSTWKAQDMTVQKCRHLFETANSLISSNLDSLGIDDFVDENQRKTQDRVFAAAASASLHSARTAQEVYVSNVPMVEESLKIVNMLDHFVAQNISSQDMNKTRPSEDALSDKNQVLYYFKHPSFKDDYDSKTIETLFQQLREKKDEELKKVMKVESEFQTELNSLKEKKDKVALVDLLRALQEETIPRTPTGSSLLLTVSKTLHNLFLAVGNFREDSSKNCEKYFWSFEMMRIKPEEWKDVVEQAKQIIIKKETASEDNDSQEDSGDAYTDEEDSEGTISSDSESEALE